VTDRDLLVPGERPCQPWGSEPPPAPPTATPAQQRRVRSAWRSWSHFRPVYEREGEYVRAEINLKDNIWSGRGQGETDEEAAWNALQACIVNWQRDIANQIWPAPIRRWLRAQRERKG
jgi:hypothetical protein